MKGFSAIYILIGLLIAGLLAGGAYLYWQKSSINSQITDYESCIKLQPDKPQLAIYPGQCTSPDGRIFTQQISEEEKKKLVSPKDSSPSAILDITNWKIYTNNYFSLQYPSNMTAQESQLPSRTDNTTKTLFLSLNDDYSGIIISLEPNTNRSTAEQWMEKQKADEEKNCEIDCLGFSNKVTTINIAREESLEQDLASAIGSVNVYIADKDKLIWASATTKGSLSPSQQTRQLLLSILNTLSLK